MMKAVTGGMVALAIAALMGCGNLLPAVGGGAGGSWSSPSGQVSPPQSHGGPVRDHVSLVDALRARGLTVELLGDIEQVFLKPRGTRLGLRGGALRQSAELQSFNYDTVAEAEADAASITPDGNTPTTMITWVDDPHFFRKERVLVLYVGKDPEVLALLSELLGPQFAGR